MKTKIFYKRIAGVICSVLMIYTLITPTCKACTCDNKTEEKATDVGGRVEFSDSITALSEDVKVSSRLWELLFGSDEEECESLVPGGEVFGIRIKQKNVTVVDAESIPALSKGDAILSINGQAVSSVEDVRSALACSGGRSVTIRARHNKHDIAIEVTPTLVDGEYKLGLTLRDTAVGIGTVTFIDPETGLFGGLGHGICDGETGELVSMESGVVCGVILGGVHRGECGKPGELSGVLTEEIDGTVTRNCECGIFGIMNPENRDTSPAIAVASRDEVTEGEATIISTLRNGKTARYKVVISDIDRTSEGSKSFRIKVTDPTLTALSGGIVRGMSGSPIIQNGKLVGAVTHVMVADPTEGYGIFIENMLNAAEGKAMPKAA